MLRCVPGTGRGKDAITMLMKGKCGLSHARQTDATLNEHGSNTFARFSQEDLQKGMLSVNPIFSWLLMNLTCVARSKHHAHRHAQAGCLLPSCVTAMPSKAGLVH